jgi:RHS repeat-associated protein
MPAGAAAPTYLCVRNGEPDGSRRVSSAVVTLNGVPIVSPSDLNQQVAGFRRKVTFQANNVLQVELRSAPGSRLTLCGVATDSAAPVITMTAPAAALITRQTQVDAVGMVEDQTALRITVNGALATVSGGTAGKTSFTATVPLPLEGTNRIVVSAVDAAGNRTDSTRTVTRDTEAPVVTLDALPDSALYRSDSLLTVTGTITDRTAVTANVNGQPLAIDSVTHAFSQVIHLSQGANFVFLVATDAAGNATTVTRQITVDNTPPTLTVTAPAEGAVTREATALATGAAIAHSPVTVTVNGAPATLDAGGGFSVPAALVEGDNTITMVATNAAGVTATVTRTLIRDTAPPALAWSTPLDSAITSAAGVAVSGTVTDRTVVTLTLNGAAVAVNAATGAYATTLPLGVDGAATLTLIATDAAGNATTASRVVTRDATPPEIAVAEPAAGLVTNGATVHVSGSVFDLTASTLMVNGVAFTLAADGGFAGEVPLVTGSNTLTFAATDAAGNHAQVARTLVRDADPPAITMASPSDNVLTRSATVTVSGTIADVSVVTATLNGVPLVLATDGSYATTIPLAEGTNILTLVATDAAGNSATTTRSLTLDTTPPALAVSSPADGTTTEAESVPVSGTVIDASVVHVTINGAPAAVASGGAFDGMMALTVGANSLTVVATDSAGNVASVVRSVTRQDLVDHTLPPNPITVAPRLDRTVATIPAAASAFLYTGANPIQVGVAPGTIKPVRAATLRGRVITTAGAALPGAVVTVAGHPELGTTKSRADGWYDIVVNGGGQLTIAFAKPGYLGAQRGILARQQDWSRVADVALVALDPVVTPVQFGATTDAQVARGGVATDADGPRQATVIVDAGTSAFITTPDGVRTPVSTLSLRLTEFTVGPKGRAAMPAMLPPSSGYTYAAGPTADEAIAAGGVVTFDKPISAYVENFVGFPVGTKVPVGTYDGSSPNWSAQPDGRVIKVLSVDGGVATVDADGDGAADSPAALAANGFSAAELTRLAATYQPGATLMRGRLFGLYPFDYNFPFKALGTDPVVVVEGGCTSATRDVIKCDVRNATQSVAVPGTSLSLAYTSARSVAAADRTLDIPITGSVLPAGLKGMYVHVTVAGQTTEMQWLPAPNVTYHYAWDGNDAYGRPVQGSPSAVVEIGNLYPAEYQFPAAVASSFGLACSAGTSAGMVGCEIAQNDGAESSERHAFWRVSTAVVRLGGYDAKAQGLGGFDFNVHHQYDPIGKVLYLGDGRTRVAEAISPVITHVAGRSQANADAGDGGLAVNAGLDYQALHGMAVLPDGRYLLPTRSGVRVVSTTGVISRFVGGGYPYSEYGHSVTRGPNGTVVGEGGPANQAFIFDAVFPVVGTDGTVYVGENHAFLGQRLVKVSPDGILTRVAGSWATTLETPREGLHIHSVATGGYRAIAIDASNNLYLVMGNDPNRVYRLGSDSLLHVVAGDGTAGASAEGAQATATGLYAISAIAVGPDGSLYIMENDGWNWGRGYKVTPNGVIRTFIGGGGRWPWETTDPLQVAFYAYWAGSAAITVSPENVVYVGIGGNVGGVVFQLPPNGTMRLYAGGPECCGPSGDRGPSLRARFGLPTGLQVTPDGSLLVADYYAGWVWRVAPPMPGFMDAAFTVASEDGSELYSFDAGGRHLRTVERRSGATRFSFEYDDRGALKSLRSRDGDLTRIERNSMGEATAIIASNGQRTAFAFDAFGNLSRIEEPDGQTERFNFEQNGLLSSVTDRNGETSGVTYDASGRVSGIIAADGGQTKVSLVPVTSGQAIYITSAAGMRTTMSTDRFASGDAVSNVTLADGRGAQITRSADGTVTTRMTDGSQSTDLRRLNPSEDDPTPLYDGTISIPTSTGPRIKTVHKGVAIQKNLDDEIVLQTDSTIVNGRVTLVTHDELARTLTRTTATGLRTVTWLDALGRVTRDSTPGRGVSSYAYNASGQVVEITRGGRVWRSEFDPLGRLTAREYGGRVTRFQTDAAGRVVTQVRPSGDTLLTSYDAEGNVTRVTPPGRSAHEYTYTSTGRVATYTPPNLATGPTPTAFVYDADGRPTQVIRPGADTVTFAYDSAGHLATLRTTDGIYQFGYDAVGRMSSATSSLGGTLTYENFGPFPARQLWRGVVAGDVRNDYTNDLKLRSQSVVGGASVTFDYDADLRLRSAGALTIERRASDGLQSATIVEATRTTTAYDSLATLRGLSTTHTASGALLYEVELSRDAFDRVVRRTETVLGERSVWTFGYDTTARLSTVARDGLPLLSYEYDANGNRTRTVDATGVQIGKVDAQDRSVAFGTASYGYTPAGDLRYKAIGVDTTWYHYTASGALLDVRLPDGKTIGYQIDAQGRRIGRTINGVLTKGWLYDNESSVIAEVGPTKSGDNNAVVSRFVSGETEGVPEYMVRGGVTYRLITDERGSVRLVVNATTGELAQQLDYDPFGRVTRNTNPGFQPFGFAGGLYDEFTGLTRFGARDYDPETGKWTTKDPIGFEGKTLNLYEYVSNDPLNRTDRTGLGETTLASQTVGMAVEATIAVFVMHKLIQSQLHPEGAFGPLVIPFYYGPKLAPNFPPIEDNKAPPFAAPPPKGGKNFTDCIGYCNMSPETRLEYCDGSKVRWQWKTICRTAAFNSANEWTGFCVSAWIVE